MMEQEIDIAVTWWVQQLRGEAVHITGSADEDVFAGAMQDISGIKPLSEEKLQDFAESLRKHLVPYIAESEPDLTQPMLGSYFRAIGTDYGPLGGPLHDAVTEVQIDCPSLRLPMKTMMWINPGQVKVRSGYQQEIQVIYSHE